MTDGEAVAEYYMMIGGLFGCFDAPCLVKL